MVTKGGTYCPTRPVTSGVQCDATFLHCERRWGTVPSAMGLNGHAYYLHWGVVQISLANLIVIVLMILLFVAALLLPFPHGRDEDDRANKDSGGSDDRG